MSQPITVIILDRHQLVGEGLARILAAEADMQVMAACHDQPAAVALTAKNNPRVFIADANLPHVDALTRQLLDLRSPPQVLILATDCQPQQALDLLSSGAVGYLCKTATTAELAAAVRHASRQEMVLDPAVAKEVVTRLTRPDSLRTFHETSPEDLLTEREREILVLLCQGITDKEIAQRLCISIRTVNGHLRHIYAKLGVHSRSETMHLALEKGWLDLL